MKEDPDAVYEYIYQINARRPTGELAFKSMTRSFAFARRPMLRRIGGLDSRVPVTFIYGSRSWIDSGPGFEVQSTRTDSFVDVRVIQAAGHHVYADATEEFNEIVQEISEIVDNEEDIGQKARPGFSGDTCPDH